MQRFYAALSAAFLTAVLVHNAGMPWWRSSTVGDASDCGVFAFNAVWFALRYLAEARQVQ